MTGRLIACPLCTLGVSVSLLHHREEQRDASLAREELHPTILFQPTGVVSLAGAR